MVMSLQDNVRPQASNTGRDLVLVSDRTDFVSRCAEQLSLAGFEITIINNNRGAIELIRRSEPAIAVIDLTRGQQKRLKALDAIRQRGFATKTVIVSQDTSLALIADAMKRGATDYIPEPLDVNRLVRTIGKILGEDMLAASSPPVRIGLDDQSLSALPASLAQNSGTIASAAAASADVVMVGGDSLARSLYASAVHALGARRSKPFKALDCAAMPSRLLRSEVFGHAAGAHPDAYADLQGSFFEAHQGVLLLDNFCALNRTAQTALLQALQNKTFQREGSVRLEDADVRIILGAGRDLGAEHRDGRLANELLSFLNQNAIGVELAPEKPFQTIACYRYLLSLAGDVSAPGLSPPERGEELKLVAGHAAA